MKKTIVIGFFVVFVIMMSSTPALAKPPMMAMFDITVNSNVTNAYDYEYNLYYGGQGSAKGISHWWLEINCAHSSIARDSIYGSTTLNNVPYDWIITFAPNDGGVPNYDDWVIKWDYPDNAPEIPKTAGGLIGTFGFHSSQPPVDGNWGAKGGRIFETGGTQVPLSTNCDIPEPASLLLFGIGAFGFGVFKRRKR